VCFFRLLNRQLCRARIFKPGIDSILMENNFDNKLTDIKRAERKRRTELGMLDLLIDTYPAEAQQKMRQKFDRKQPPTLEKSLVFRSYYLDFGRAAEARISFCFLTGSIFR
jgi:hypothetical protein